MIQGKNWREEEYLKDHSIFSRMYFALSRGGLGPRLGVYGLAMRTCWQTD